MLKTVFFSEKQNGTETFQNFMVKSIYVNQLMLLSKQSLTVLTLRERKIRKSKMKKHICYIEPFTFILYNLLDTKMPGLQPAFRQPYRLVRNQANSTIQRK